MTQPFDIGSYLLDVVVQTTSYANEFSWEITSSDLVVCSGGPYTNDSTYDSVGCVITDGDYTLRCIDSYGDGWHGGSVTIEGNQYCQDFTSQTGEDAGKLMTAVFTV